ncbi:MAG: FAD-dependent oxidoreductase [Hyphomicrobiales bacterium]|nr:FAD-dependent oxidoreductase [Hyphomicrobiales bacterium]
MSDRLTITFEGRKVGAHPGQSLGAALAASGELALRQTAGGDCRGMFCGMGVCQDCLVTVDGAPNQRACMVKAADGMVVRRQAAPGETPPARMGAAPILFENLQTVTADVLVIGGGAGGLSAALAARSCGLDVLLLDERQTEGGQYYKQPSAALKAEPLDRQQRDGAALRQRCEGAGVRIIDGAETFAALDAGSVMATHAGRTAVYRARAMVIATGAYERAVPIPGWTLPGVMTTGALQTLWRSHRALPGHRILIAGNGPLNLQVACEVMAAGADVVAVAEAAALFAPARAGAALRMALHDPSLTAAGLALMARARRGGASLRFGQVARAISAVKGGLEVELGSATGGHGERFVVDVVALGYGFQPSNELLRALGARHDHDPGIRALRTVRTRECETTVPNLFAVGDACGLGGALAALEEGEIAGLAIAERLGARSPAGVSTNAAHRRLEGHRRFQAALWRLYDAPSPGLSLADDATLICRCEEVSKAALLAAMADGEPSIGAVKRRTRAGMGRCQGRYCGPLIAAHLAEETGRPLDERALFAPRAPVKPVTISDLVGGSPP